ncbi:MAG: TIGR03435 family protein, partial [Terriglobia bacterium]
AQTCRLCRSAAFLVIPTHKPQSLKSANSALPAHLLPALIGIIWLCGFMAVLLIWYARWRRISAGLGEAAPLLGGREVEALRRLERVAGIRRPIAVLLSRATLEPGIFGVFRPVLVWPKGISERLDDGQLEAILAHELWHVRRRDNLAALLHMVVEAVFWFHPLVWWMGGRMVEERERACDEGVLQLGNPPQVYAESILKACEFCVGSPLACVSGVTGSDLKKRIVRIMTQRVARKLGVRTKLLLVVAGFLAVALPIGFGLAQGRPGQANPPQGSAVQASNATETAAPKFEVASIKPAPPGSHMFRLGTTPGRFNANGVPAKMLIEFAYNLKSDGQLVGAPGWVNSQRFNIDAKEDDAFVQKMRKLSFDEGGAQVRLMVQSLLADRFKLRVSRETRERPVYALVIAKNGPKLTATKLPPPGPMGASAPGPHAFRGVRMQPGQLTCMAAPISLLVNVLSRRPELGGRLVQDKTGLKGSYDFTLKWTPEMGRGQMMAEGPGPGGGRGAGAGENQQAATGVGPAPDSSAPSIFTAIQEQLGLKLKPEKGPVEVLVIDHIEPPTPN